MSRPQFSIRLLLLTVSAVAVDLALMLQVPKYNRGGLVETGTQTACIGFSAIIIVATVLALTGLGGQPRLRAFCTGALVPLILMLYFIAHEGLFDIASWLDELFPHPGIVFGHAGGGNRFEESRLPKLFGVGLLLSISLGYLCVVFRWFIEPRSGNRP